jgi:hypothetical protein
VDGARTIGPGVRRDNAGSQRVHLRLRRLKGDAGTQPGDHRLAARRAFVVARPTREPDIESPRDRYVRSELQDEARRQDAGDRHRDVVHLDRFADDVGVAVPAALPQLVGDVDCGDPLRTDVLPRHHPAEKRLQPEHLEEVVAW